MRLFRLVDLKHDPIVPGQHLTRPSDHSNQKLGEGMYFALSFEDAKGFLHARHKHPYTHVLEVEIPFEIKDFADLRASPNLITGPGTFKNLVFQYCQAHGKRGVIWTQRQNEWTELMLLSEYISHGVQIIAATPIS